MSYIDKIDGFEFVSIHYPFYEKEALRITDNLRSIDAYLSCIHRYGIDSAEFVTRDLRMLHHFPMLKHLRICPSADADASFDYSPLYDLPEVLSLSCRNRFGDREQYISKVDYSKVSGLVELSVGVTRGTICFNRIPTLKSLRIWNFSGANRDVTDLSESIQLDTLYLAQSNIRSLNGLSRMNRLEYLHLYQCRSLEDISSLSSVKDTLKSLQIELCPQITDFSVLRELFQLERLHLSGSNRLPDLAFLRNLENLRTFTFDVFIESGDLTPCLDLSYVYCGKNRNHYNLRDKDLPKIEFIRGNENIETWRRLE